MQIISGFKQHDQTCKNIREFVQNPFQCRHPLVRIELEEFRHFHVNIFIILYNEFNFDLIIKLRKFMINYGQ